MRSFDSKKAFSARNELNKVVIVGGDNKVGVWRRIPQPPEASGNLGAEPCTDTATILQFF